ncbi:MAG: ice-binding family protein [Actinomycetota bacterium]|nr:ice-binding family protein [Actinomycetota bacterium]
MESTLTTASASSVRLINGAQACNVYWQVGSSATLGSTTDFKGNILALTSILVNNGVTVDGRLLARNGAVTLINDRVTRSQCAPGTGPGTGPPGSNSALGPDLTGPAVRIVGLPASARVRSAGRALAGRVLAASAPHATSPRNSGFATAPGSRG